MSSGFALVRFPNGEIRYGVYSGTVDFLHRGLYDTMKEAFASYRAGALTDPVGDREEVEVYTNYGGGMWWTGTAWRNAAADDAVDPWNLLFEFGQRTGPETVRHDGMPEWAKRWADAPW